MAVAQATGMSGAGKSMALAELAQRGHQVVDTDDGDWIEDVPLGRGLESERLWREDKINALISEHVANTLFISGCVSSPTPARVEPLLRAGATAQIDTTQVQPDQVADELERIAGVAT